MQAYTFLTILIFSIACNQTGDNHPLPVSVHPKLISTIGNGNVQCGLQDKDGNLWFGTTGSGLYKFDGKTFKQFTVNEGLSSNSVHSLLEDKEGKIWIGTEAGPCFYDGKTFTKRQIDLPDDLPPNTNKYHRDSRLVYDMIQSKTGTIWFVTIDGVYTYDGVSFRQFIIDDSANGYMTGNDKVERILEDNAGNIWFGGRTNEGVYKYDGRSVTNLTLENSFQDGPTPKAHNWGWPQLQDSKGNIWFSNWGGVYRFDGTSFKSFTKEDGLNNITQIIEDQKGNIWFGGAGGLTRYDGRSFTNFKGGLTNPWIWALVKDKAGDIWVGTRQTGLYRFDGKKFINYSGDNDSQ